MTPPSRSDLESDRGWRRGSGSGSSPWRLRSAVKRLAHRITPRNLWNRRVVPGELVVATFSQSTARAIEDALRDGVGNFDRLHDPEALTAEDAPRPAPKMPLGVVDGKRRREWEDWLKALRAARAPRGLRLRAWSVAVPRGTEEALLRELEHRVSEALEKEGGYRGIDRKLSIQATRRLMTAHQARRLRPSADPSSAGPIAFTSTHDDYRRMLGSGPSPSYEVGVAVIDTNVDPNDLPEGLGDRVRIAPMSSDLVSLDPGAHGAVTAAVIADLSPTALIEVYPVLAKKSSRRKSNTKPESAVTQALLLIDRKREVHVVAMCLEMSFPGYHEFAKSDQTVVEMALENLKDRHVVIVPSGNRGILWESDDARFPATNPDVMMVGAVDKHHARPKYSCYILDKTKPAAFLVAPGGRKGHEFPVTANGKPQWGTSIAAAYAAGVVARSLGSSAPGAAEDVYKALETGAFKFPGHKPGEHGAGLIQQVAL